jgi:hypothetical protein
VATSWLLADVGEANGRQDLHAKREPEKCTFFASTL